MEETQKSAQAKREEETLAFWQKEKIFEQSLEQTAKGKPYVFYDGPPFATGLPHYGHILASTIKDVVPRYQTMKGRFVARRWGWDCHGLPIENIAEKDLKISGKKGIETIGVKTFNEHARSRVLEFIHDWKKTIDRVGRWVDFDGSYKTMDSSFMESIWWAIKEVHNKGLLYEGTRVLPYCPRCETPIANSEIAMDNSYRDIKDWSVYVKFKLKTQSAKLKSEVESLKAGDIYLVAWTTTPWTLPGNVALAVNPEIEYSILTNNTNVDRGINKGELHLSSGKYIIASLLVPKFIAMMEQNNFVEDKKIKGSDLVGLEYQPVFDYYSKDETLKNREQGWKVYTADFVSTEEGTGIVHIAPAFGEDDMALAKTFNLPIIWHVDNTGRFKPEVADFAGQLVKPKFDPNSAVNGDFGPTDYHQQSDIEVIKYLAAKDLLFAKEKITHSYPHCFRCETPLYYYAIPAWFINIQTIKSDLLNLNEQKINWIPTHLKEGRFKNSLESAPDWNISRNRYWATPLPIWKCQQCQAVQLFGSVGELQAALNPASNQYRLMRHGETTGNLAGKISFGTEAEDGLTDKGREEVKQSAELLAEQSIDLIITSPFRRAKESAEIVAASLGLDKNKIIFDERLIEANPGNLDGHTWAEYHALTQANDQSGRETLPQIRARMMSLIFELEQKYTDQNILIVGHGLPLRILSLGAEGVPAQDLRTSPHWDESGLVNAEIKGLNFKPYPHNDDFDLDLHRPYIDEMVFPCDCGGQYRRIPEVVDCWLESGSMPFAAQHYPFQNQDGFGHNFPAQFISEYVAQTRTWFYYMLVMSAILFDEAPFENVVTTGTVLAADGQKMSKSKGNFPDPWLLLNKFGADTLRFYLLSSPIMRSEDLNFSEQGVGDIYRKIVMRLENTVLFLETYGDLTGAISKPTGENILDRWILSRLNQAIESVTTSLDRYELDTATRPIEALIDDLSNWFLRRSRDRFKSEDQNDQLAANQTLRYCLIEIAKLTAPFMPFIAEDIYRRLGGKDKLASIHLATWPGSEQVDSKLLDSMIELRRLSTLGLELRAKARIKVRQPLAKMSIQSETLAGQADLLAILADELNVKSIAFDANLTAPAELDLSISPELKAEGLARDLMRLLQEGRKQAGLSPADLADLEIYLSGDLVAVWQQFEADIKKVAKLKQIRLAAQPMGETTKLDQAELAFKLDRAN